MSRLVKGIFLLSWLMGRSMPKKSITDLTSEEVSSLLSGYRFFCKDLKGRRVVLPCVYPSRKSALSALSALLYMDSLPKLSLVVLQRPGYRQEVIFHA